jgi:S-DNA-T family DNA segregation ATPase FtsK/SpoIIIE
MTRHGQTAEGAQTVLPLRPIEPVANCTSHLAAGFGGWIADARRARRGCLTAPQTIPEGDLIGVRLTRGHTGNPIRPGRALLNSGDGILRTVTVPAT